MLFGYPVAATQNNWLHDCLCVIIRTIHEGITANRRWRFVWVSIIPEQYRSLLQGRTGLRDRLSKYVRKIRRLSSDQRQQMAESLASQNDICTLLQTERECIPIDELPESAMNALKEVFLFSYTLLTEFNIRDEQYRIIYANIPYKLCPFCGIEYFDAPGAPSHDFDHYLLKSKYPFAAANLYNLVPAGDRCNRSYKARIDILHRIDGTRRRAFYPYAEVQVSVFLDETDPMGNADPRYPQWIIRFEPDSEETQTWDEVFRIQERYRRDILIPKYRSWLDHFSSWFRSTALTCQTSEDLLTALNQYCEYLYACGLEDRAFLKYAVFKMLRIHCENGNERLIRFLFDVVRRI